MTDDLLKTLLNMLLQTFSLYENALNENCRLLEENQNLRDANSRLRKELDSANLKLEDKTSSDYLLDKLSSLLPNKEIADAASLQQIQDAINKAVDQFDKKKQKELELLKEEQYGQSSEKQPNKEKSEKKPNTSNRKQPERKKDDILSSALKLPLNVLLHTLSECPLCGGKLEEICAELARFELKYTPPRLELLCHYTEKYKCLETDALSEGTQSEIVSAKAPPSLLRGSIVSSSVVGRLIHEKVALGIPYRRLEPEWAALGLKLKRDKMARWCILTTEKYLTLLYERMKFYLVQRDIVMADETRWYCLDEPDKLSSSADWMWVFRNGPEKDKPPIKLYLYSRTRNGENAKQFLQGFQGYLVSDGFGGYNKVENSVRCLCFSHLRRYFLEASPLGSGKNPPKGSGAEIGASFINRILANERKWMDCTAEERYRNRIRKTLPILDQFFDWVKTCNKKTDNEYLQKAFTYAINNEKYFRNFLRDGRIPLTNNLSEQCVKAVLRQRQSSYFSDSRRGATTTAIAISIVETAVANGIPSEKYLSFVLEHLKGQDLSDTALLDNLLPWSPFVKENCGSGCSGGMKNADELREAARLQLNELRNKEKIQKALASSLAKVNS